MSKPGGIEIDIRCACGGTLLVQYEVESPYRDDLCKLAVGWVAAHAECQKAGTAVRNFARAILHGDEKHCQWLLGAADDCVAGRPIVKEKS